jgi:hypothetical protein
MIARSFLGLWDNGHSDGICLVCLFALLRPLVCVTVLYVTYSLSVAVFFCYSDPSLAYGDFQLGAYLLVDY